MKYIHIKHVVFSHYKKLRWYFISTLDKKLYYISINPFDIINLAYGIFILIPPLTNKHIKGNW